METWVLASPAKLSVSLFSKLLSFACQNHDFSHL